MNRRTLAYAALRDAHSLPPRVSLPKPLPMPRQGAGFLEAAQ